MLADYHVHTEFSEDSSERMEDVVKAAIALEMDEICFTDHVDYGIKLDHDADEQQKAGKMLNVDYTNYFSKIEDLKEKFREQIVLKRGLEFGIQTHTIDSFQKIFDLFELDFIILSCHQVRDKAFWTCDFQKGKTPDEYNAAYYREIYDCICSYKDYSVVGHLDMIQRYNEPLYPFEKSKEMIAKILMKIIKDNKGIEINTSSFRYGLKDLMPARYILSLYKELGGKIITIGSDCHKAQDLGDHIPYTKEELIKLGFEYFCTFEKMKPIFHKL